MKVRFLLFQGFQSWILLALVLVCLVQLTCATIDTRTQRRAIIFSEENLQLFRDLGYSGVLTALGKLAAKKYDCDRSTVLRWYREYRFSGEFPYVMKKRYRKILNKAGGQWKNTRRRSPREYDALKNILDQHPECTINIKYSVFTKQRVPSPISRYSVDPPQHQSTTNSPAHVGIERTSPRPNLHLWLPRLCRLFVGVAS